MTSFEEIYGFRREELRLANWRTAPYARFAFQQTREIVPTAVISCGGERPETAPKGDGPLAAFRLDHDGAEAGFHAFLEQSHTDGFVAMKDGEIVSEWHAAHAMPDARHLLFSITKSFTGLLAGILEDDGILDADTPVIDFVPEAAGCAYGDATVRHLLDMRVSLDFEEIYLDTDGDYDRYRRAMLWNPARPDRPVETLTDVLTSLPKAAGPHGGPFQYQSPNTDMLGLAIERATGKRYGNLASQRIWQPIGAFSDAWITVDSVGLARAAGGMCTTARDLARFGEMVRTGGMGANGRVVSQRWIDAMLMNGDRTAWAAGDYLDLFPYGRYRDCWYQTGYETGAFCCIGIHGQWLYVDPVRAVTLVKLSSQPVPADDALDQRCLAFFRAVCDFI